MSSLCRDGLITSTLNPAKPLSKGSLIGMSFCSRVWFVTLHITSASPFNRDSI
ncbi:hypothetical protein MGSAQ_001343 [marine sediment metagenome]|uniref:Uncharacterized protein n=1 Tax=marine sediment metagenome TaxID=412755 RepID=A0A1B6NV09_9ZZZZ